MFELSFFHMLNVVHQKHAKARDTAQSELSASISLRTQISKTQVSLDAVRASVTPVFYSEMLQ